MHFLAVAKVSGPVGGRAHERMAEPHPDAELDQPGLLGRPPRVASDPELLGRPPQQAHVADRLGRRHQQQALGLARKRPDPLHEGLLDAAGQRPRVGKAEPARELGRRQPTRQLQQRQWVAARLGDDLIAHALVQPPRHGRRQQRACVAVGEPADDHLRQAAELVDVGGLADGEHHGDPLGQQAPRHEGQRLRGGPIEPLHIVDQAHERIAPRPPRPAGSGPPGQRGSDPAPRRPAARTPPAAHLVAGRGARRARRASARTADAARRRRAPSRTRRPRPGRCGTPRPARRRTPAAPSCRPPPRRAAPAPSSAPPGRAAADGPAPRTRSVGLVARRAGA